MGAVIVDGPGEHQRDGKGYQVITVSLVAIPNVTARIMRECAEILSECNIDQDAYLGPILKIKPVASVLMTIQSLLRRDGWRKTCPTGQLQNFGPGQEKRKACRLVTALKEYCSPETWHK